MLYLLLSTATMVARMCLSITLYVHCRLVKYLLCGNVNEDYLVSQILFLIFNKEAVLKISGFVFRTVTVSVIDGMKTARFKSAQTARHFAL
jgi:hypothetical protein